MNAHYVKMKHKCVNKTNIKICIVEGGGGGGGGAGGRASCPCFLVNAIPR